MKELARQEISKESGEILIELFGFSSLRISSQRYPHELDKYASELRLILPPHAFVGFYEYCAYGIAPDCYTLHASVWMNERDKRKAEGKSLPTEAVSGQLFQLKKYPEQDIVMLDHDLYYSPSQRRLLHFLITEGFLVLNPQFVFMSL